MSKPDIGRIIGQVSAVTGGTTSLAFAIYVWTTFPDDRSVSWVMLGMFAISAIGFYASLKKRPIVLIAVFVATFFPMGLWLALHPHWARIAGLAPLGYLVSAFFMSRRHSSPYHPKDDRA